MLLIKSGQATCPVAITETLLALLPKGKHKCTFISVGRRIVISRTRKRFHESKGVPGIRQFEMTSRNSYASSLLTLTRSVSLVGT